MKLLYTLLVMLFCITAVPVSAQSFSEGHLAAGDAMIWRLRSFDNSDRSEQLYVGIPPINNPNRRVEEFAFWNSPGATKIYIIFDRVQDQLEVFTAISPTAPIYSAIYENWSSNLGTGINPDLLNSINLTLEGRQAGREVVLENLKLDGRTVNTGGRFGVEADEAPSKEEYNITGYCFGLDQGFVIEADLVLGADFASPAELSNVEFAVGSVPGGYECPDVIFKDSFETLARAKINTRAFSDRR